MEGLAVATQETVVSTLPSDLDVVRAWKDARYRRSLSAGQLQSLPANPAGPIELTNDELKLASGLALGAEAIITTAITCTEFTFIHWKACGCIPETTAPNCTLPVD